MFECELFDADDNNSYLGDENICLEPYVGMIFRKMKVVELLPDTGSGADYRLSVEFLADDD